MKSVLFALAAFAAAPVMAAEHSMAGHANGAMMHDADADVAMAEGKVNRIDADNRQVNVTHGPIASFNWPPMTMDLKVADATLLKDVQTGDEITFRLKRLSPKDYVIIELKTKGEH